MKTALIITQIVLALLLVISILSQEKGAGLSGTFGGSGQLFTGRRGVDKILLWITVILAVLFVAISVSFLFIDEGAQTPGLQVTDVTAETDSGEPVSTPQK